MIKFYQIPFDEAIAPLPIKFDRSRIAEWENGGRQDVIENTDIFCENVRSKDLKEKDFSLFQKVRAQDMNRDVVVVYPIYLELFEFLGMRDNIRFALDHFSKEYGYNNVVFFWNHDVDFAQYNQHCCINTRVINYNTSQESPITDIIVPFWTMGDITPLYHNKTEHACFVGSLTHRLRGTLFETMFARPTYNFCSTKRSYEAYREYLAKHDFCFCPRGAGLSSYRFFECFHTNTIPILFADDVVLPYNKEVDWSELCVRIPEGKAGDFRFIHESLVRVNVEHRLTNIAAHRHMFTLQGVQEYVHRRLS